MNAPRWCASPCCDAAGVKYNDDGEWFCEGCYRMWFAEQELAEEEWDHRAFDE